MTDFPSEPRTLLNSPVCLKSHQESKFISSLKINEEYRIGKCRISGESIIKEKHGSTIFLSDCVKWKRIQPIVVGHDSRLEFSENKLIDRESSGYDKNHDAKESIKSAVVSKSFLSKSKFSQEKYLLKKLKQHGKEIQILKPSLFMFSSNH